MYYKSKSNNKEVNLRQLSAVLLVVKHRDSVPTLTTCLSDNCHRSPIDCIQCTLWTHRL